ncbi:MAG TPA: cupin domain-containing protein [Spirochaetota bacterium]|nr:cupin domain-containing protein [Spirochaetota bacterium]HPR49407.1 cupin domain-containing protein [Spirochaetota bacterium]
MFTRKNINGYTDPLPGIKMKTIAWGEKTLMTEFLLSKGSVLPPHSHPHEQTGYLVSGRITLIIGDRTFDALPGDCWCILSGVEHQALAHEDSVAVEVFSPLREEYLPPKNR